MSGLSRYLDLIAWGSLGVLCAFMFLIARLFQKRSGLRTRPGLFALAASALVGTGVAEALHCCGLFPDITSSLLALAGLAAVVAVVRIHRLMTGAPP